MDVGHRKKTWGQILCLEVLCLPSSINLGAAGQSSSHSIHMNVDTDNHAALTYSEFHQNGTVYELPEVTAAKLRYIKQI